MKYCWTTINVKELDKSILFYRDILGLDLIRRIKPNPDMELAFLGSGETQVELISNVQNQEIEYSKNISMGFVVESIDLFTVFLNEKGIDLESGPFQPNPYIKFIYILDPDGLKIQLVENIETT